MKNPLVSIIVPCYNVEKYIVRCLISIANQTYSNIEVLLVDDCGDDKTFALVEAFLSNYYGDIIFKIIYQECNKGPSSARNRGVIEAKGDYIYFLDSDDDIYPRCIELLVQKVEDDDEIEMVVGNYKIRGPLYFDPFLMEERTYNSQEIIKAQFNYDIYTMPWNKLIKRDFLLRNKLLFDEEILLHEDNLWSFCCALCLNKVSVVLAFTYNYYIRPASAMTGKPKQDKQDNMLKVILKFVDFAFLSIAPDKKNVRYDTEIFKFVESECRVIIMDPVLEDKLNVAKERYHILRKNKYWSFYDTLRLKGLSFNEYTRFLHWLLPEPLGFVYYKKRNIKHHYLQPETNHMKLSVLTINYNNLSGLQRTIPSILSQTYTGYELIVIDGGSTDGSKEFLATQDRINYWVSEPDQGIYNAMNKAVNAAHGEYCIFMNSGDVFFCPQTLMQCIDKLGTVDIIGGRSVYIENDKAYPFIPPRQMNLDFLFVNALCHQSVFTKTEILRKYPFDEHHRIVSDWAQYFKAWYLHHCTFAPLDIFVSIFFLDGISATNKRLDAKERDETIRQIIDESGEVNGELEREYNKFLAKNNGAILQEEEEKSEPEISSKAKKRAKRQQYRERLWNKLQKSLNQKSPIMRDLGVIKYGFKFLFKDLFL